MILYLSIARVALQPDLALDRSTDLGTDVLL